MPSIQKCKVPKCTSIKQKGIDHLIMFKFPKDMEDRSKWCDSINIPMDRVNTASRVCSIHFTALDIDGRKVRKGRFPTLHIDDDNLIDFQVEILDDEDYNNWENASIKNVQI